MLSFYLISEFNISLFCLGQKLNQKNNGPPHTKVCGLIGPCFLDDRSVDHILKDVVLGRHYRHQKIDALSHVKKLGFKYTNTCDITSKAIRNSINY